jgi:hypothetical protein
MRIEMTPGWDENVAAQVDLFFDDTLGPAIVADAKRYAPVDTGALERGIHHFVEHHTLIVEASTEDEAGREYAADVEMGHRVAHGPKLSEVGPKVVPPRPYLRPALYQVRGE